MIDKSNTIENAIGQVPNGASIMVGGFGVPGTPFRLIDELVRQGPTGLTLIKNDANEAGMGIDRLLQNGQVRRLIVSHMGLNPNAIQQMNEGDIDVEICAQGILAERIRAAGAGIQAIVTDIGAATLLADGKEAIEIDGKRCLIEQALAADFALLHADTADTFGNHTYAASARNFSPLMAMAADTVIVETERLVEPGEIAPEAVHTPGPFVDHVVLLDELSDDYGIVRR